MNMRRSCRLALLRPSVWHAKSEARDQSALRLRIREIAMDRPRFCQTSTSGSPAGASARSWTRLLCSVEAQST